MSYSEIIEHAEPGLYGRSSCCKPWQEGKKQLEQPTCNGARFFFSCLFNKGANPFLSELANVFNDVFISCHSSFAMRVSILFRQQLSINVFSTILPHTVQLVWPTRRKKTYLPFFKSWKHHVTAINIVSIHNIHKKNVNTFPSLSFLSLLFQLSTSSKTWQLSL